MSVPSEGNNLHALENQQQQKEISQQQRTVIQSQPSPAAPIETDLEQGITCAPVPTSLTEIIPQPPKLKRKQVKNACVNCQKACKKCDDERPCQRCIRYELTETCKNSIRKERKKGIKRGPYKRRTQQKDQDKASIISIPVPTIVPVFDGQINEQHIPINFPIIPQQILGTQGADGVGKFIIIPQNSGGTSYYILMPVQQNQPFNSPTSTCVSKASLPVLVQDIQVGTESEPQPEASLSEEGSQNPKLDAARGGRETTQNKEKDEKNESNLSVLSLVCSGLLDQNIVSYEQANKEIAENRSQNELSTAKQNSNAPVGWNLVNNEKQQVVTSEFNKKNSTFNSVKNQVAKENLNESPKEWSLTNILVTPGDNRVTAKNTTHVTPQVCNEDHQPSFEQPSIGNPLLFSIPANTYPVSPAAQYVPIKHDSRICNMKRTNHQYDEFQLSQHNASFSQNQISMQQQYYGISPFTSHSAKSSSNTYMSQNQSPFYQLRYNNQQLPQQITPTSLSFAFSPGINTSQSVTRGYASVSSSQNGSNASSQGLKSYSNYQM
ncbi:hypothetical protein C1645_736032 [Glomus cerebriforme]|uniref:Zn(2)-C6 fungal-type domain-containing protein n=1 Tax=Glomus cerebriforme TaxID=658196 RepID=A0A397T4T6_9GLOM|nr:hypothetical protein C1645_736032 [Glomus cerebriforme]